MTPTNAPHLVPLGGSGWSVWRDSALRSAGFPARLAADLADHGLARVADAHGAGTADAAEYAAAFTEAEARLSATVRRMAADPLFREAVTWQNRALVANCLDKAAAGEPRNVRGRNHEMTIVGHLQRYALKNDTIGFFGPVGWAAFTDHPVPLRVTAGDRLLARRTVYFENWAIDAVARKLSADPTLQPWIAPRRDPGVRVDGLLAHRPEKLPLPLTAAEAALLTACDGDRTVRELARELVGAPGHFATDGDLLTTVQRLTEHGVVAFDLEGPIEAWPETTLRKKLGRIGEPTLRDTALAVLDRLTVARDGVAAAAGDAERLTAAMDRLNTVFQEITGEAAVRHHGRIYAGRTVVYEDTVRDVHAELGAPLRDDLSGPLGLVLDSARWLVNRIGAEYTEVLTGIHQRWVGRTGTPEMPLTRLLGAATPHMYFSPRSLSAPVRRAVADFQERWQRVLDGADELGTSAARRSFDSRRLADRVRAQFPAAPPAWATAIHHAPDLMIAAASPEAVADGDYQMVLGELHASFNSLESRLFVEQHPLPDTVRAADAADHAGRRIYLVPPKDWLPVTSRLAPPSATLAPDTTCWTLRTPSVHPTGTPLALADLFVHEEQGLLVVRDGSGSFEAPLLEMLSESLSTLSVNSFKPFPSRPHRPRITVDRLVVAREAWSFRAADLAWAALKKEPARYLGARAWRAGHGLPERAFYKSPLEDKPVFVDFTSLALVNMFAKAVRQAAEADQDAAIGLTEMLPDTDGTWLADHQGERYTAELRVIALDPLGQVR
ncbi:lantibiotic dehydratase [Streptomyces sp. NPDC006464]|uniref:lantibiotic dehydratase n=1 Tax=Streptomyces sp. NPDC006464 TaxID=3154305 RepID=UPI00339EF1D1